MGGRGFGLWLLIRCLRGTWILLLIVWGFHWTHKWDMKTKLRNTENKPRNMAKAAMIQRWFPCTFKHAKKAARFRQVPYFSESSPADHFEHLEVFSVKAHLLHGGCEWLHCEERWRELVMKWFEKKKALKWPMEKEAGTATLSNHWHWCTNIKMLADTNKPIMIIYNYNLELWPNQIKCQTINCIQNKSFHLCNIRVCTVYICYVYINTHTCIYMHWI